MCVQSKGLDRRPHRHRRATGRSMHPYVAPDLVPSQMDRTHFVEPFRLDLRALALDRRTRLRRRTVARQRHRVGPPFRAAQPVPHGRASTSGWACSPPTPIWPASWRRRSASPKPRRHEQSSAGLDALTDHERAAVRKSSTPTYVAKFGFPFIIAVRDNTKEMILKAMRHAHRQ